MKHQNFLLLPLLVLWSSLSAFSMGNYAPTHTVLNDTLPTVRKVLDTLTSGSRYNEIGSGVYCYIQMLPMGDDGAVAFVAQRIDAFDSLGNLKFSFDVSINNPFRPEKFPNAVNYKTWADYEYHAIIHPLPDKYFYKFKAETSNSGMPVIGYSRLAIDEHGGIMDEDFIAAFIADDGSIDDTLYLNLDVNHHSRSADGRFFGLTCGGIKGEGLICWRDNSFLLYDLQDKKLVYRLDCDRRHMLGLPVWLDKFQCFFLSTGENEFAAPYNEDVTYYLLYPKTRTILKKTFIQHPGFIPWSMDETGFIVKENGALKHIPFSTEFESIRF